MAKQKKTTGWPRPISPFFPILWQGQGLALC